MTALASYLDDHPTLCVGWAPQEGGQRIAMSCPHFEVLLEGPRGTGKTDWLGCDFLKEVGKGYGAEWNGIIFRQTVPQLRDVIKKTRKWFKLLCPDAVYNKVEKKWTFPDGETLRFDYFRTPDDYWNYHGHEYTWIGWEELTTWKDDKCYTSAMSLVRSAHPGIPKRVRATTNPYGVGHNWVKQRFRLPTISEYVGEVIDDDTDEMGKPLPTRVAIHSKLEDNIALLEADPEYLDRIRASAANPSMAAAWIEGSWDITSGGMFDDLWDSKAHVVPSIPLDKIPGGWRIDRGYDHGQSAPFAVGWFAESNGEPIQWEGRTIGPVRGDIVHIAEWYGWNGTPNEGVRKLSTEIAKGIVERERDWGLSGRVRPGPADTSIFDDYEPGKSVAGDMQRNGVSWEKADKGPGSRKQGWEQMRKLLKAALPHEDGTRDQPGFFVSARCEQFRRTMPSLPRSEKDPDDVDTDAEDHIADMVRYRLRRRENIVVSRTY